MEHGVLDVSCRRGIGVVSAVPSFKPAGTRPNIQHLAVPGDFIIFLIDLFIFVQPSC